MIVLFPFQVMWKQWFLFPLFQTMIPYWPRKKAMIPSSFVSNDAVCSIGCWDGCWPTLWVLYTCYTYDMYVYIYIYIYIHMLYIILLLIIIIILLLLIISAAVSRCFSCTVRPGSREVGALSQTMKIRPVRLLRLSTSGGLTQANS